MSLATSRSSSVRRHYENQRKENKMQDGSSKSRKLFIVVQDYSPFKFSWGELHDPGRHDIALLTSKRHYSTIQSSEDAKYFIHIDALDDFSPYTISQAIEHTIELCGFPRNTASILCNDEDSIAAAAKASNLSQVGGMGNDFIQRFKDKILMKKHLTDNGIRVPKHIRWSGSDYTVSPQKTINSIEDNIGYPCFAKPLTGSGSIGTKKMCTRSDLIEWCDRHHQSIGYEIDEFIDGTLFHCDSVIYEGDVLFTQVSRYIHTGYDFLSGKVDASLTLGSEDPISQRLTLYAKEVLLALAIEGKSFVSHMEVFLIKDGSLVFLEVAARAPGGRVVPTYQRHLGCNFEELNFKLQMGIFSELDIFTGPYAGWAAFPSQKGRVKRLHPLRLGSAHTISWRVAPGDATDSPRDVADYVATVEIWNDDQVQLENDMALLSQWIPCEYETTR